MRAATLGPPTSTPATPTGPLLSDQARRAGSSAIRDLLAQASRPGMISLAGGIPDATRFPTDELADIARRVIATDGVGALQYGRTEGTDECRAVLSTHLGFDAPESLLITTGAQQGLTLTVRALINPGDRVIVSEAEYVGMLQVLQAHGAVPVAIPADHDGLDTEHLADLLASGARPKACYLVPHFHNPTGATIAADRWAHLGELSARYGFVVIEDDPYRDLYFDHEPPTVVHTDPDLTVHLRSTSKSLAPGLRVGVVRAPHDVHRAMVTAKQSLDLHTSTLGQAIVCEAVRASWYSEHLAQLRASYSRKCGVLRAEIDRALADRIDTMNAPGGGMFLWVGFTEPIKTEQWLGRALDQGVCFVPGGAFSPTGGLPSSARFSFATASEGELVEAVRRLAASLPTGSARHGSATLKPG